MTPLQCILHLATLSNTKYFKNLSSAPLKSLLQYILSSLISSNPIVMFMLQPQIETLTNFVIKYCPNDGSIIKLATDITAKLYENYTKPTEPIKQISESNLDKLHRLIQDLIKITDNEKVLNTVCEILESLKGSHPTDDIYIKAIKQVKDLITDQEIINDFVMTELPKELTDNVDDWECLPQYEDLTSDWTFV